MTPELKKQALAGLAAGDQTATVQTPQIGLDAVSLELHKQFNNPNLEAAILANIDRETGGTFNYQTWEGFKKRPLDLKNKQTGGYGLFQYTGKNLTDYKNWLLRKKLSDSMPNQIQFMKSVYGPSRKDWRTNILTSTGKTREQLADWWHRYVETPGHVIRSSRYYSPTRIQKYTLRHNNFMKYRLKDNQGVWTEIPLS